MTDDISGPSSAFTYTTQNSRVCSIMSLSFGMML